jgi:hypothetical protein
VALARGAALTRVEQVEKPPAQEGGDGHDDDAD